MISLLTLSPTAATMLDGARGQRGVPEDATLRIAPSTDGQHGSISLGFVDDPFDGDQTGDAHGLPYCVAPEVAPTLEEATIDVQGSGEDAHLVVVPGS